MNQKILDEQCFTFNQISVITAFQKLFLEIEYWLKAYYSAVIFDTPNLKSVTNYLTNLPSKYYSMLSIFYGTETGLIVEDLVFNLIKSHMEMIEFMKYDDNALSSSKAIQWYQTADKFSSFLAETNVYWDESQWKYFLYEYFKLKEAEIRAVINNDYEEVTKLYEQIDDVIYLMSSYMARGIIASTIK